MSKQITLNELKEMDLNKLKRVDLAGLIYDVETQYLNQVKHVDRNEFIKRHLNGVGSAKGFKKDELIDILSRRIEKALELHDENMIDFSEVESVQDETLKELLSGDETFRYSMLDRLLGDCRYYLGYGNRCSKHLWAKDEHKQIELIKGLYNSFDNSNKPNFITIEGILQFEKEMTEKEYIKSMLQEKLNKISIEYNKNNFLINQHMISYEEYEATERRLKYQYNNIEQQIKNL